MKIGRACMLLLLAGLRMLAVGGLAVAVGYGSARSAAGTEQVLYNFCAQSGCHDGADPAAGLIMDAAGNLYGTSSGTSYQGTTYSGGSVFQLVPSDTGWSYKTL